LAFYERSQFIPKELESSVLVIGHERERDFDKLITLQDGTKVSWTIYQLVKEVIKREGFELHLKSELLKKCINPNYKLHPFDEVRLMNVGLLNATGRLILLFEA
jgi:hypothetical protein